LLVSGPPGIGKTSAAHLVAKLAGFNPIELNASDTRSKKLIESSLKETINNTSLDGWYHGGVRVAGAARPDERADMRHPSQKSGMDSDSIRITDRTCLIMDEVDGMSGGDRGGVGAINVLIRKTKVRGVCCQCACGRACCSCPHSAQVPIICICNDAKSPKMKPLESTCAQLKFTR
jgi:replication factor C subunit 1